jgi:biopolymer transport protein ExbB
MINKLISFAQFGAEAVFWLLLILSVISVAIIIERFWTLNSIKVRSRKVFARLREALQANQLSELEDLSRDRDSLEGRALSYGIRHFKKNGERGIEEIFNGFISMERGFLEKHLNFLATVGSNAPFIGLLGTVFGIMKAFRDLSISQGDAAAVMAGISEALGATAFGLFVAIPAVIAYNSYQKQVKLILQNLTSVKELCVAYAKTNKGGAE